MALTTDEIVKMVIAVLVLVVVAGGAYMGYTYYLKGYFQGLGPGGEDYNAKNEVLVNDKQAIARAGMDSRLNYITFEGENAQSEFYICKGCWFTTDGEMFKDDGNAMVSDKKVGFIDVQGRIHILTEFVSDTRLAKLDGAIKSYYKIAK